jgi:hypothetical protein
VKARDLPRGTDSPQPLGTAETDAAGPSRLPNGAVGQKSTDARGGHADPSRSPNGANGRGPDGRFARGNPGGPAELLRVPLRASHFLPHA